MQKKKKPSNAVRYLSGRCPILAATEGRKRTNASKLLRGSKTNPLELLTSGRNPLTMQTEERRESSPHRRASCRQKQRRPWTLDRPDGQAFRTQTIPLEVSRKPQFHGRHCRQQHLFERKDERKHELNDGLVSKGTHHFHHGLLQQTI
jgi:hypothetical protein